MRVIVITLADDRSLVDVVEVRPDERTDEAFRRWVESEDVCDLDEALEQLDWVECLVDTTKE